MLLPSGDPSALLQYVLTAIAVLVGLLFVVRKVGSRYFVVDDMSIGGSSGGSSGGNVGEGDSGVEGCAVCGKSGAKRCSGCKNALYCSQACQSKHWGAGHKFKCKQAGSSDDVDTDSSKNAASRRRKSSGFGPVCLVPSRRRRDVLQEPKRILFPYDEFVQLFNWKYPGFPPCGLLNCGNSCFANVVLQCLTCTQPLLAYLLEKDHRSECIRKQEGWCFLCELQVHVQSALKNREPFSPVNILSRLPNIGGNLGYGSQEDAHEFMRFAIDTMQSACLDEYGGEKALNHSTQETTLIQHIFGGHLQSQVTCTKCNTISNRYENMMDLTVEIHGDAESLEECLDQFTVREWLDGENMYKCDGCNDYVKAWKRLTVHQAPNILTITLKRFQSGRFGKLNKRVTFPENLNLTPYMGGNDDGTNLYSLYAVVVHLDMLNASFFGHYICYTKDFEGHWYRIDDCKVTNVEVDEVLSQGAYMLLYSRRSPRKEPFIRPTEAAKKKQFTLADIGSSTAKAAGSCVRSNIPLRGTEHDREVEIKFDALREDDSGDVVMTNSDTSSSVAKDLEDQNSTERSLVASIMNAQCNGISDSYHCNEEDPKSLSNTGEVSTLSGYATDTSVLSKSMARDGIYDKEEISSSVMGASSANHKSVPCDFSSNEVHKLPDVCDIKEQKVFSSTLKPKLLFSRGFLDRARRDEPRAVLKTNGYSNGISELESDADSECVESISDRSKNNNVCNGTTDSFTKRHYTKPSVKSRSAAICCNGSAELVTGLEASCSSQSHDTLSNGIVFDQENVCSRSSYAEDVAFALKMDNDDNEGPVENGRPGKLNGSGSATVSINNEGGNGE